MIGIPGPIFALFTWHPKKANDILHLTCVVHKIYMKRKLLTSKEKVIKRNIGKDTKPSKVMMSNYAKKYKNMKARKSRTFKEYVLQALT